MSIKYFAASFNGRPQAAAFRGSGYAFGSPLNDMIQMFTSTMDQKPGAVQLKRLSRFCDAVIPACAGMTKTLIP
jgi:hypothetical protein